MDEDLIFSLDKIDMKRDTLVLKFERAESKANNKNLFSLPFSKDDYYLELANDRWRFSNPWMGLYSI